MSTKGNGQSTSQIDLTSMIHLVTSARDCFNRSKENASEAAIFAYIIHRNCQTPDAKKWLKDEITQFNADVKTHNDKVSAELVRAKQFMSGTLPAGDPLNDPKPLDPAEQQRSDEERARLRALSGLNRSEHAALRKTSANERDGASPYNAMVKYVFGFDHQNQSSMVARYCSALEWIHDKFSAEPQLDMEAMKLAMRTAGGFDRCVDLQRAKRSINADASDASIIKAAIKEAAVCQVRELPSKGMVDIAPSRAKDGFVLLVGRVTDLGVQVLDEAVLTDNVILQAVNALGSKSPLDADPACEFLGRVLDLGGIIRDRQEVANFDTSGAKSKTERMISIKPGLDGRPQLVVSVNKAESGAVLHAQPFDPEFLSVSRGACVLNALGRKSIEDKITDLGRRSLYSVKLDTDPKTPTGKPSQYALTWKFTNRALEEKKKASATSIINFVQLSNVTSKPLDIANFEPSFEGVMDDVEINRIFDQLLKPWDDRRKNAGEKKDGSNKKKATEDKNKFLVLELRKGKLTMTCGDADPVVTDFKTNSTEIVRMQFRIGDIHDLFNRLRSWATSSFEIVGDEAGLLCFSWRDHYGSYRFFLPTVLADGKLQTRRVAAMRAQQMQLAAE